MTTLHKAQHELQALIEEIRTTKRYGDDQKAQILRATLGALPDEVTQPVVNRLREESAMAEKIRAEYGLTKDARARDALGRFAPGGGITPPSAAASGEPDTDTVVPWIHSGAPIVPE